MKIFKSAVVAFSLAIAMGSFSTAAVAEAGRTSYKPQDAVKGVLERLAKAEAAIASNAAGDDVAALIKVASDFSEEINANDKVARENSKNLKALKGAVAAAKAGKLSEAQDGINKSKEILANIINLI